MLTVTAIGAKGETCSLPAPLSLEIAQDRDTPADSLRIVFPEKVSEELAEVTVTDGGKVLFTGIVDEQILTLADSTRTEIIARSMAALLLDNMAVPRNFVNPCTQVLFNLYMKPYGMESYVGENRVLQGSFNVSKGMSCWQVLEAFAKEVYGTSPRVEGRTVNFEKEQNQEDILFSNSVQGVTYSQLEYNRLRCKLISKVRAKTQTEGDYTTVVSSADALSRGIQRERYIDASRLSATPLSKAYEALENGALSSEEITLRCPLCLAGRLSAKGTVRTDTETLEGFYVKALRYTLSNSKEVTRVTLRRKEN